MNKNANEIENLTRTVKYLESLISELSNTDGNYEALHCFALKIDYEDRISLLNIKIEELETELQQYKTYISDITETIQRNICKDFCPNIKPVTESAV